MTKEQEKEANLFALALLMPKERFIKEFKKLKVDLLDEKGLEPLCKKFGVTHTMVVARAAMINNFFKSLV